MKLAMIFNDNSPCPGKSTTIFYPSFVEINQVKLYEATVEENESIINSLHPLQKKIFEEVGKIVIPGTWISFPSESWEFDLFPI